MLKSLIHFFKRTPKEQPAATEPGLDLQQEAQRLRLELAESQQKVERLKAELERARSQAEKGGAAAATARLERLFSDLAAPAAQLHTQAHLVELENKPLQAGDVLVVAKALLRSLQNQGLAFDGQIGERLAFDPDQHEPLSAQDQPQPGQEVILRFAAVLHQGRLLKKAGVTLASREEQS